MTPTRRWALSFAALLAGCALSATPRPAPPQLRAPLVLLGEVHDNEAQHALRLAAFDELLARGARPALLLEAFDREHQAALDARRAASPPPDAGALITIAGGAGWDWRFYRPFVERALRHALPIVAVNVGRAEAQRVMRDGLAAHGFDPGVPPALLDAQAALIERSHCGQIDAATARRMALAQVARDQSMARALEAQAARGALLLAGNVHVRTDIGVPVWLDAGMRARSESIGFVEDVDASEAYDRRIVTAPQPRPDPCAPLMMPRG